MLFVLIALWLIAGALWLIDPKSSTMRWMSAVALTGGFGALAAVISNHTLPYVQQQWPNSAAGTYLYRLMSTSSLLSYYGLPYAFARLALAYNTSWPAPRLRMWLPLALLVPPIACWALLPGYTEEMPIQFNVVAIWAFPYILCGAVLVALKKEQLPAMKRTHIFTCLSILPPILSLGVMNYVMPSFGFYRLWIYHSWILAFVIPFFIFTFFRYGFLGMQLLIERRKMDSTLRAITSGTAILNHAIKNDIGKMRLFLDKIRQHAEETGQKELLQDLQVVVSATTHIRDMISRVHEQTQELPLRKGQVDLKHLLEDVIGQLQGELAQVELDLQLPDELVVTLDEVQIGETLTNLFLNAVEAMPHGGRLSIRVFKQKRKIVLEIRDTGTGMDKATLKQAVDPFFTTKGGKRLNFGLGLAYCYSVMKKHGGSLEMSSKPGEGTSVFLSFPMSS
ncbi:ATP-binding protein [Paenibacillus oryzisoli]|uniref:sensor histidine kinase n=1 Tax=Paenibacillus oryzisoli TaxID=1850517 RepID=UPI003D2A54D3